MKFRICCAAAALSLVYFETSDGGALKKTFSKEGQIEDAKIEKDKAPADGVDGKGDSGRTSQTAQTSSSASSSATKPAAQVEKKKIVGDPIVLKINGKKEYRRSQILADMKLIPPQMVQGIAPDKLFEMLVTQKLNTYLMIEQAKKAGLDRTKDFMERVERFKEELLGRTFLIRELAPKAENEAALKARYTKYLVEFKKGRECKVFHIMVSSEKAAKEALESLAKGADFSKLAAEKSEAPSKSKGGEEGYIPLDMLPAEIKDKISALKDGEYTKDFLKTENGFHIFKITDSRDTTPQKFEEAKDMLKQVIMHEEMMKLLERLEKQAKVERFNEDGSPFTPAKETPETPSSTTATQPTAAAS
ncbi:MAG: peptidyl-prolyl cis-trans isomerase [Holosporaceae bacterium]|nr:peptidyl-prolyl cis-trans isomerase [Holosporaceae bacterium]